MELQVNLAGERLYRSSKHAWIFGVCGGIAHRFDVSPLLIRSLAVMLCWTVVVPILYLTAGFTLYSDILSDEN